MKLHRTHFDQLEIGDRAQHQPERNDKLWGCGKIAEFIELSQDATYRLLERGQLPARKVGGRWMARRGELDTFLTSSGAAL